MAESGRVDEGNLWRVLKRHILRNSHGEGIFRGNMPELSFHYHESPELPVRHFMDPVLIVIAQGSKFVKIGDNEFVYPEGSFFVSAVDLPVTSSVIEASSGRPYLSVSVELDLETLASYAARSRTAVEKEVDIVVGAMGHKMDAGLLDTVVRLVEVSESAEDMACLKKHLLAEMHYRLLKGNAGSALYALCSLNMPILHIRNIIGWIKENYKETFTISDLSGKFNIAPSTIHKYFKAVTTLSPIQYQKMLRLSEARRLLEGGSMKVADAAEMVGYESPTQFSREYKRLYGDTPRATKRKGPIN